MVPTVGTRLYAITTMSIICTMVIFITCMKIISTNMLSRLAIPTPCAARPRPGALIRMVRAADTNKCRTVITSITLSTDGCITHMMAIAMTTDR